MAKRKAVEFNPIPDTRIVTLGGWRYTLITGRCDQDTAYYKIIRHDAPDGLQSNWCAEPGDEQDAYRAMIRHLAQYATNLNLGQYGIAAFSILSPSDVEGLRHHLSWCRWQWRYAQFQKMYPHCSDETIRAMTEDPNMVTADALPAALKEE